MRYENSKNTQTLSILSCTNPLDNKNMYFQSQVHTPEPTEKNSTEYRGKKTPLKYSDTEYFINN